MLKILGIKFTWHNIILGISLSPIFTFIQKYLYNDWEFLIWLLILVTIDTMTGVWKSYKQKQISSKGFSQVITKITVYGIFLIVVHILQYFTIDNKTTEIFNWLDNVAFSTLLAREAISIFENLAMIEPRLIPKKILIRLKAFDDDEDSKK